MKHANLRKTLIFVLVLMLLSIAIGCTKTETPETTTENTTKTTTESTTESTTVNDESDVIDKTPITLSAYYQEASAGTEGTHQEAAVFQKIEEDTGVTIDIVKCSVEKYKVLMAGGNLPDIIGTIESMIPGVTAQMIESQMIIPLDELLEEYGQNIVRNIPLALKWSKELLGGGVTYVLPIQCYGADTSSPKRTAVHGFEVRWDLYEAIGKPEISGEEEFLDAAEAMQEYCPVSPNGKKTYAFSAHTSWGTIWQFRYSYPRPKGWWNLRSSFHVVNLFTDEFESNATDPESSWWDSLEFYNKAYQRGLFDPEAFIMTDQQYYEKIANGEILIAFRENQPLDTDVVGETLFVKIPGVDDFVDIYQMEEPLGWQSSYARAISSNCEYPERAMQLLNYLDSPEIARTLYSGIQGVHWDYVDGVPKYIGEYEESLLNGTEDDYLKNNPITSDIDLAQFFTSGKIIQHSDGYPINLEDSAYFLSMFVDDIEKEWSQQFDKDFTYRGQVYEKWCEEGKMHTVTEIPLYITLMEPFSEETTDAISKTINYFNENLSKVVLAENDEAYEAAKKEIIEAVVGLGMLEADAEVEQKLEDAKELAKTFK